MTLVKPAIGSTSWGASLNAALDDLDDRIADAAAGQAAADAAVLASATAADANVLAAATGGGTELREVFSLMSDGIPSTTAATRQTMVNYGPSGGAAMPYVRSGFLSTATPNSAEGGAYRIAQLARPAVRVGARFAFSSYTVGGGLLCLSIQATSIATNAPVPVSPLHFWVSPTDWSLDVNDTAGTAVETVATGTFATPLTADGAALYTVEVVLDRDRRECHLILPDGNVLTYADARFALAGSYVYVEPFKTPGSLSSKTNALVREWWADSRATEVIPQARARAKTAWVSPTLGNSWVNHPTYRGARYRREGDWLVIDGYIRTGTLAQPAFTIPAGIGMRPLKDYPRQAATSAGTGIFTVYADGRVMPITGDKSDWYCISTRIPLS